MRGTLLALVALAPIASAGCSEPQLEFHLAERPDQAGPLESPPCETYGLLEDMCRFLSGPTAAPPCRDCVPRRWIGYAGEEIELQIERRPFLTVATSALGRPEILQHSFPYQPICELFALTFRRRLALESLAERESSYPSLPTAAVLDGRVIAVGRSMINGETLTLRFGDRASAEAVARELGFAPSFRPEDPALGEERRRQALALMRETLADEQTRRTLARRAGVSLEELDPDVVATHLLCP